MGRGGRYTHLVSTYVRSSVFKKKKKKNRTNTSTDNPGDDGKPRLLCNLANLIASKQNYSLKVMTPKTYGV